MTQLPHDLTGDHDDSAAELTALMTRAVGDLQPPVGRLQQLSVSRGRRIRRRRQGGALLGGAAAATALVVLVAPGVGGSAADGNRFAVDPSGGGSLAPTPATTTATTTPESQTTSHGFWEMPSDTMRNRLTRVLPPDVHVIDTELAAPDRAPGEPAIATGWLRVDFTRSGMTGEGTLEIILWGPGTSDSVAACPGNLDLVAPSTCTELVDQHGAHVGRSAEIVEGDLLEHLVTVVADHGFVYAGTANTTDPKWGPASVVSAPQPLLTPAEVRAVAQSGSWTAWTPPAA